MSERKELLDAIVADEDTIEDIVDAVIDRVLQKIDHEIDDWEGQYTVLEAAFKQLRHNIVVNLGKHA